MSDGRHAAASPADGAPHETADGAPSGESSGGAGPDAQGFGRPDGVAGGFAPHQPTPSYRPPPPTVSPEERERYARPPHAGAFAPAPQDRLTPRPAVRPPVHPAQAESFRGTGPDGFDPQPGDRLRAAPTAESPWWKADAPVDPWRDPGASFWLGRGAVFPGDEPEQLAPGDDSESGDEATTDDRSGTVRRGRFGLPALGIVLLAALVAGLVGGGVGWFATRETDTALHRPDASIAQVETPTQRPAGSIAGVAKRVGPAVVSILVTTDSSASIGSGVVIDKQGDVLTNNHVISDAIDNDGSKIKVTFSNEDTALATVVGHDPVSDLAVIRVPDTKLTVATLGRSDQVAVGDTAIAIGSPLGLQGTVTAGIVSALNRPVHVFADDGTSDAYLDAIQTDAPINPGNSGGALVNSSGAVIGINSAAAAGSGTGGTATTGIGYAIPIDYAHGIALDLIRTGRTTHAKLGAQGKTYLTSTRSGAYLVQVTPGGSAAKAGLSAGDVVVGADGSVVQSYDQLVVIVQQHKPGAKIPLTYYPSKSAATKTVTVTLS